MSKPHYATQKEWQTLHCLCSNTDLKQQHSLLLKTSFSYLWIQLMYTTYFKQRKLAEYQHSLLSVFKNDFYFYLCLCAYVPYMWVPLEARANEVSVRNQICMLRNMYELLRHLSGPLLTYLYELRASVRVRERLGRPCSLWVLTNLGCQAWWKSLYPLSSCQW